MKLRKLLTAGAIAAVVVGLPATAMADDYTGNNGSSVLGTQLTRSAPAVAPASTTRGAGLPVTGGDIAGMTAIGLAAVGTGTAMVRRSRKRSSAV